MDKIYLESLKSRHAKACDLDGVVDKDKIVDAVTRWVVAIGCQPGLNISFVSNVADMNKHARAVRAAWAVRDAWAARAARDAWAAWAAWDARDASFELSYISIIAIGAISLDDNKTAFVWLPTLDAFEAGAYALWVTDKEIFVATRPTVVKTDDQRRLHCANGPAFEWLSDISDYYWHGVNIPKEWLGKKSPLTAKTAMTWKNIEQRRAACEILGWAKILKELDATTIDKDGDPEIGELVEVTIPEIGREKFLRVLCATKREFALPVPPTMKTALEAQAWTFGFTPKEFAIPEIRT